MRAKQSEPSITRATKLAALALALAISGSASLASAQTQRAIVLDFSGPGSSALQREVRGAFDSGSGWEAVPEGDVASMARRLGAAPDSREVAAGLGVSAIIEGRASRRGRRRTLEVEVRDASSGSVLATESFTGRNARALRMAVRSGFWDAVGFSMARGQVPQVEAAPAHEERSAASAAADVEEERPAARAERAADSSGGAQDASVATAPSALFLALGMTIGSRELSYNDDVFLALRPYSLPAAWGLRGQARWYPGAHFTSDFLANIGIDVTAGGAIGLSSRQRDGTTYGTEAWDLHAGVDVRIPLAPVELGLGLGYGAHTFGLGASESGQMAELPNVAYQYVRPAARFHAEFGAGIYADVDFGWRILTASGAFGETWFPRSSGTGFDLAARLGWESDLGLGVRAGFEMQRYFFTLNPEVGDPYIAGGAVDQFLTGTFDLTYRL